ncbi:MAG: hypothetical protein HZA25_00730 [Candidatus Niyogibacteria bacterium]|nr:hypothetical protein [Candidatus Niyogibacteria bacterium]
MLQRVSSFVVAFCVAFVMSASATQVTVDLEKITPEQVAAVMAAKQSAETPPKAAVPTVDQMEKWADVGAKVGQAIAATAKELNVGVNEFAKTPVGLLTMGLITWKVIGHDLLGIIGGTLAWIAITSVILFSFSRFHISERIKDKERGTVTYVPRYRFESSEAKGFSAVLHALVFIVFTGVCLVIIF